MKRDWTEEAREITGELCEGKDCPGPIPHRRRFGGPLVCGPCVLVRSIAMLARDALAAGERAGAEGMRERAATETQNGCPPDFQPRALYLFRAAEAIRALPLPGEGK